MSQSPACERLLGGLAVYLMIGLADGVHHAHGQGILHRDLKPTNILLRPKAEPSSKCGSISPGSVPLAELCHAFPPMVADFGLARLLEDRDESSHIAGGPIPSSNTTLMAGTPQYMSPEQLDVRYVATGSYSDDVALWNTKPLKVQAVFKGHTKDVRTVVFSPDSRVLASAGRDRSIRRWKIPKGELPKHADPDGGTIRAIVFATNDPSTSGICRQGRKC